MDNYTRRERERGRLVDRLTEASLRWQQAVRVHSADPVEEAAAIIAELRRVVDAAEAALAAFDDVRLRAGA